MRNLIKENGIVISILIIWLFIHVICLMLSVDSPHSKDIFYPFTESRLKYSYDIIEFLIYGISPFVLFIIIKLINNEEK